MDEPITIEQKKYSRLTTSYLITIPQEDRQILAASLEVAKEIATDHAIKHGTTIKIKLKETGK